MLVLIEVLVACGSIATSPIASTTEITDESTAPLGAWSVVFVGKCQGREAKNIHITTLNDEQIIFEDFMLTMNDDGQYTGHTAYVAPMPADGRDIIYTIGYRLIQENQTTFVGDEIVVESGSLEDSCPIQLLFEGDE